MKQILKITYLSILAAVFYACGGTEAANDRLAELNALKEQRKALESQIETLESELKSEGIIKEKETNKVLVTTLTVEPTTFLHKIDVRGTVSSRKNVLVSAETMGRVQAIYVTEGQKVSKGKLLLQLDADIIRSSVNEVKTQLELATTMYERQTKLWEQNIGTEVQYLQAKNNKEALDSKLATLNAQLQQANVYAPFDGIIDDVPVREGEMAQPGMPLLRIVNQNDVYISADVSESYLGKFSKGQTVDVYFPATDKQLVCKIQAVGQVIKSENRTFEVEVGLSNIGFPVKPNQVVVLDLVDYESSEALVVPTKIIQRDSKGSYVYELVKDGEKTRAKKIYITPGITYDNKTEIVAGLQSGQVIANEGYRDLAPDVLVAIR